MVDPVAVIYTLVAQLVLAFMVFMAVYVSTRPWENRMAMHVLAFMGVLFAILVYALFQRFIPEPGRHWGWVGLLIGLSIVSWWRTSLLIAYQLQARRERNERL